MNGLWHRLIGAAAAALLLAGGCSQLDVNIRLNTDGSAHVTERMAFSRTQLEQEIGLPGGVRLKDLLTRQYALQRAARMGAGCTLVGHKLGQTADAGLEAVAEYDIPDINDLRYLPPMFGSTEEPASVLRIEVGPCYARRHATPDSPGQMYVQFTMQRVAAEPKPADAAAPASSGQDTSPVNLQALRELLPVAKDLLKDCRIRIVFEAYDILWYGGPPYTWALNVPGTKSPTNRYLLVNCSGGDLDTLGKGILDNEEAMLEVLRGDYAGVNIQAQAAWQRGRTDARAPTFYTPTMNWENCRLRFAPSAYHYKRYFDGKLVGQGGNVKD